MAPNTCPEVDVAIRVDNLAKAHIFSLDARRAHLLRCTSIVPVGIVLGVGEQGVTICDEDVGPIDIVSHLKAQILQLISLA